MDRVRTGIDGLDQLLYGGFLRGDAALIAGSPGTGKTSLGMQFLYNGIVKYRQPGLFITFEEFPERIYRDADNFGWDFRALEEQGQLKILFTSPEVLQQDIVRDQGIVAEMIAETGAARVVVDSISNLDQAEENPHRFREAVYGLVNALKSRSLTALLTRELHEDEEIGAGPEEFVADSLILLTRRYVGGHSMRFLEILKSRGSPHIAIPSLYFLGQGGMRILPPFSEPFYRFEEAVSTGISQLDDLLGGGVPYGGFYLFEIDAELHEDVLDAGFAKEALEVGDLYVRVAAKSDQMSRWRALLASAGLEERLEEAIDGGEVTFLAAEGDGAPTAGAVAKEIEALCTAGSRRGLRFSVDMSRLFGLLPAEQARSVVLTLAARCRQARGVVLGVITPQAVPADQLEKLRAAADGIVRIWTEGSYSYLRVIKTVNSARTPIYAIALLPRPPFVEIMAY